MADTSDLQSVRARFGVFFDKQANIKNQCAFAAMCLALPSAHGGYVTRIDVRFEGDELTITDDGPGLPVTQRPGVAPTAQRVMCDLAGCADVKPHPQFATMMCGISIAAVNAISTSASVVTMVDGIAYAQKYALGAPVGPLKPVARDSPGTRLRFTLDKRWAGRKPVDLVALENQVLRLGLSLEQTTLTFSE